MRTDLEIFGQMRHQMSRESWMQTLTGGELGVGMGFDGEVAAVNMKAPAVVERKSRTSHKP